MLGFLSVVLPVIASGNTAIVIPSENYPLITGDLYQLMDTSDLPGGVVNTLLDIHRNCSKFLPSTTMSMPSGVSLTKQVLLRPNHSQLEI